jgi:cytochrome b6-f complex iron-sulfur subunit
MGKRSTRKGPPATPSAATTSEGPSRRSFLSWAWLGLGVAAAAEAVWVVVSFVRPRQGEASGEDDAILTAGPEETFEPGSVTAFQRGRFYLVRLEDGGFLALDRRCTHLGCTVPWDESSGRFACPCHASSFDLHGDVLSPPAPRPLDLFAVRIENGIVKVDTSRPIRRTSFEASQVTRS